MKGPLKVPHTHCRNGHLLTPQNVRVVPSGKKAAGKRQCRQCRTALQIRYRTPAQPRPTLRERRLSSYIPVTETGCWLFTGPWNDSGYGKFAGERPVRKHTQAHRYFYEQFVGPIPDGLLLCHKCDTPPCVNPVHMFVGTHQDNMADMVRKGRHRHAGRTPHAN